MSKRSPSRPGALERPEIPGEQVMLGNLCAAPQLKHRATAGRNSVGALQDQVAAACPPSKVELGLLPAIPAGASMPLTEFHRLRR